MHWCIVLSTSLIVNPPVGYLNFTSMLPKQPAPHTSSLHPHPPNLHLSFRFLVPPSTSPDNLIFIFHVFRPLPITRHKLLSLFLPASCLAHTNSYDSGANEACMLYGRPWCLSFMQRMNRKRSVSKQHNLCSSSPYLMCLIGFIPWPTVFQCSPLLEWHL